MNGTDHKHPAQPVLAAHPAPKTIRCTEDNAAQFQQLVKNDPELLALVQALQAQGLFPGLRAMSITLTGTAAQQALGLAAWPAARAQIEAAVK